MSIVKVGTKIVNSTNGFKISEKLLKPIESKKEMIFNTPISQVVTTPQKQTAKSLFIKLKRILLYPFNKLRSKNVPNNITKMLSDLIPLSREQFGQAYYKKLVKLQDLESIAHKEIELSPFFEKKFEDVALGFFDNCSGKILVNQNFKNLSRATQANMITHELEHLKQTDIIIRAFGINRYIKALEKSQNINFSPIKISEIKEALKRYTCRPKIEPNSELYQKAEQYLEATENYPNLTNNIKNIWKYYGNILEKEAYKVGDELGHYTYILENLNIHNL